MSDSGNYLPVEITAAEAPKISDVNNQNRIEAPSAIDNRQQTSVGDHGRLGLSTVEAEKLYEEVGFNELQYVEISAIRLFLLQFYGMMPFILELACVLALAIQSYIDFAIIFIILLTNACLGFHEELTAKEHLLELTNKMEQKVTVVRDGHAEMLLSRLLVPGDVLLVQGGTLIPADTDWLEGDILSIDTSTITGETMARKYPSEQYGKRILAGTTVQSGEAYCIVRKTGSHTEIGSSQEDIMHDKASIRQSFFEQRVLRIVKAVILVSLVVVITILLVQGIARGGFSKGNRTRGLISSVLSILVASVPVALPLVLQVTMALGAGKMARDYNAVVTSLSALQDISSMSILCSDKTGTLTTARISIHEQHIWCPEDSSFKPKDVTFYARLASNPDKEDDPVDRCCLNHFRKYASEDMKKEISRYKLIRSVGFNPNYKRVVFFYSHPEHGVVTIAKGLPNKVADTSDGGKDDADEQWKVLHCDSVLFELNQTSEALSSRGYKTLGVSVRIGKQPWTFVGIIPMIDPPRHDSAQTIRLLQEAGVAVKMVTGDHENIARETAKIMGMSTNILKGDELRRVETLVSQRHQKTNNTHGNTLSSNNTDTIANQSDDVQRLIWDADGFAQVLPRDKRFVVEVLRHHFQAVVGMTGDGVNDAPALSAAQCGIAVDNATDAAKNAAAIILTSPGLSAIYSAVVESRRIFRKLRAYVVYRIAASVQIVSSLTLLIFISNCEINSLFVILLALFNDLTLLPIAYDQQQASATPDTLNIHHILLLSLALGATQTMFTMLWSYVIYRIPELFGSDLDVATCSITAQNAIWVQLAVSTELLIFSTRAASSFWLSYPPSSWLVFSVLLGTTIISVLAAAIPAFGTLYISDILVIWVYTLISLHIVDAVKCLTLWILREEFSELQIEIEEKREEAGEKREVKEAEDQGDEKKEEIEEQKEEVLHMMQLYHPEEKVRGESPLKRKPSAVAVTSLSRSFRQAEGTTHPPPPQNPPIVSRAAARPSPTPPTVTPDCHNAALLSPRNYSSEEAIAFDVELGRQVTDRKLIPLFNRWTTQPESAATEERFQEIDERRRSHDSHLRRVESWIKTSPVPSIPSSSHTRSPSFTVGTLAQTPVRYQTAVSESLHGTAKRSLSGGDLLTAPHRTVSFAAADFVSPTPATIEATRMHSAPASLRIKYAQPTREEQQAYVPIGVIHEGRIVLPSNYAKYGSWTDLRRPHITASSLRPHTPASRSITMTDRARQSLQARLRFQQQSMSK